MISFINNGYHIGIIVVILFSLAIHNRSLLFKDLLRKMFEYVPNRFKSVRCINVFKFLENRNYWAILTALFVAVYAYLFTILSAYTLTVILISYAFSRSSKR